MLEVADSGAGEFWQRFPRCNETKPIDFAALGTWKDRAERLSALLERSLLVNGDQLAVLALRQETR
jgi:hypothetical protein